MDLSVIRSRRTASSLHFPPHSLMPISLSLFQFSRSFHPLLLPQKGSCPISPIISFQRVLPLAVAFAVASPTLHHLPSLQPVPNASPLFVPFAVFRFRLPSVSLPPEVTYTVLLLGAGCGVTPGWQIHHTTLNVDNQLICIVALPLLSRSPDSS